MKVTKVKSQQPKNKMKQLFLIFSVFVLAFGMSSCGSGSYDLDKCKALQEKVDNGDELTQDDYAEMIQQARGLNAFLDTRVSKMENMDLDEITEYIQESAKMDEGKYAMTFDSTLKSAAAMDELNEDNKKAYDEYESELDKYKEHGIEVGKKLTDKALEAVTE